MLFGSAGVSKFEYGSRIVAALSYLLLRQHDAVGLMTFDDAVRNVVPASSRGSQLISVLTALEAGAPRRLVADVVAVDDDGTEVVAWAFAPDDAA